MKIVQKILLFLLMAAMLITPFTSAAHEGVYVYLNSEEVILSGMAAFFDSDLGFLMAPTALLETAMHIEVNYTAETGALVITKGKTSLTLQIDDVNAKMNSRSVTLDTPPVLLDGVVYVPLRFVAENLGFELNWLAEEKRVELFTIYDYELGIPEDKMREIYGDPVDTIPSEKGYTWQVYHEGYEDYQLIGVKSGRVVAYYLNHDSWKLPFGIQYGTKLATCHTLMNGLGYQSSTGAGYTNFLSEDASLTVYYSAEEGNPVYAALYEDADSLTVSSISPTVLSSMERILRDLTNIERVRQGRTPLAHNQNLDAVAALHAGDMAANDFFSHLGTTSGNKTDRMTAAGFGDCYVSEAISKAYPDSFSTFASFYANRSYQEVLTANFRDVGVGYAYNPDSEGVLYCVQLFYAEKY